MTDRIRFIRPTGAFSRFLSVAAGFLAAAAIVGGGFCPLPALANGSADGLVTEGYREPGAAVVRLLTAGPPPEVILHSGSGRVALLFREPVIELERLARPRLGLAGYRFDPKTRTSGVEPLIERVEVVRVAVEEGENRVEWRPRGGARLDHVRFSPDGRMLSALEVARGTTARLVLFDVVTGKERVLKTPVNPAWGDPCSWVENDALLCRVVPAALGHTPPAQPVPEIVEHLSGPAPTRTYSNLLESSHEELLFAHYFAVELARVDLHGRVRRLAVTPGLIASVEPSPDGKLAVLTRIQHPFSRLVPARQFPSVVELWDLAAGSLLYSSSPSGFDVSPEGTDLEDPRRAEWKPGTSSTLGYIERTSENGAFRQDRWLTLEAPFTGESEEVVRSDRPIKAFGWSTAGTPYFSTAAEKGTGVRVSVVFEDGPQEIWSGFTADRYGNPGRALRVDGDAGAVLEVEANIFLAGDALGPDGPGPSSTSST